MEKMKPFYSFQIYTGILLLGAVINYLHDWTVRMLFLFIIFTVGNFFLEMKASFGDKYKKTKPPKGHKNG
jgi:hypothetical protein